MRIGRFNIIAIGKETGRGVLGDDLQGQAAETAYHILFSLVPLMLFLAAVTGFVSAWIGVEDTTDEVTVWIEDNLPDESAAAVIDPIQTLLETQAGGILSFGALIALWSGKNAMGALIKGLNIAFNVKEARPWWRRQLLAVGLTIGLGLSMITASAILVYGALAGDKLARLVGAGDTWASTWSVLQFPLVMLLLMAGLAFLYWAGPNVDVRFALIAPGAIFAVLGWIAATFGLSFYFARFAGYTAYGALGAVLAFIFWLYVMSLILLIGGELNASIVKLSGDSPHDESDTDEQMMETTPGKAASSGDQQRVATGATGFTAQSNTTASPRA